MSSKKVSIIIPAYNEAKYIEKTLKMYKLQDYSPMEIIVIDNSTDGGKTYKIAQNYADKILTFPGPIGLSAARNEGAKVATGEIFVFSDADSYIEQGGIKKIAQITDENIIGTLLAKGDNNTIRGKMFLGFKNLIHRLGIYQGAGSGILFCHRNVYFDTGGFNSKREPIELLDFINKAKKFGADYKLLLSCYATTSLRRYEERGYINVILFWIKLRIYFLFAKKNNFFENYFNLKSKS
jgi:glycosyltransferase involved in cell wall biosynthesis